MNIQVKPPMQDLEEVVATLEKLIMLVETFSTPENRELFFRHEGPSVYDALSGVSVVISRIPAIERGEHFYNLTSAAIKAAHYLRDQYKFDKKMQCGVSFPLVFILAESGRIPESEAMLDSLQKLGVGYIPPEIMQSLDGVRGYIKKMLDSPVH